MVQKMIRGIGVSEGGRIAPAFVYRQPAADFARDIAPGEEEAEAERLRQAALAAGDDVKKLIARSAGVLDKDKLGILKGQESILADPAYLPEAGRLIQKRHFSAEKAVRQVTEKFAALFAGMPNPYMQERAADVRDAGNRLVRFLTGAGADLGDIDHEVILVAEDLSASDTIRLDRRFVRGFATERGGRTAHTSIFAGSMGIPAVVGAKGLLENVHDGDTLILDGAEGVVIASPDAETLAAHREKFRREEKRRALFEARAHQPAATADGKRVIVAVNIGAAAEAEPGRGRGAEAVGLMRSEALFLSRAEAPSEEELFIEYRKAAEAFAGAEPGEVIIRTLDIGGDKAVPYLGIPQEANPFLGYRAIRLCLGRRELFRTQLRAILRASAFGRVKIMFPMIATLAELRQAKAELARARRELDKSGTAYDHGIQAGIMIEIPAAALMADALAQEADFFSVGTNDLTQYTLAVDRGNDQVAYLYDYFDPAILRLLKLTAQAARAHGIPLGMCGGMAGDPLAIPLLAGLGFDELSMTPGAVPRAKYVLSCVNTADCRKLADEMAGCSTAAQTRETADTFSRRLEQP